MQPIKLLHHLADTGAPPECGSAVLRLSVGMEGSTTRFERETFPFVASGGSELQFISGGVGQGKTHFLKAVSCLARTCDFVTSYVDCQDRAPFESLVETYRAIVDGMVPPREVSTFSTAGITRVIEAQFTDKTTEEQRVLVEHLTADRALVADFRNLVRAYCTLGLGGYGDEHLTEKLEALLAATPYYNDVRVGELYRQYRNIPRPLGKLGPRNAAIWLRALLSLPQVLGYRGVVVCFDDTEGVLRHGSRHRHLAHIRTFIDHLAAGAFRGCAVYYAVSGDIQYIARYLGALWQRIERVFPPPEDNPYAVSVNLGELVRPNPSDPAFFIALAKRIVGVGREAGLSREASTELMSGLTRVAPEYAETTNEGSVGRWVKEVSVSVIQDIEGTEGK